MTTTRYTGQSEPQFSKLHKDDDLMWVVPFRVCYLLGVCGFRYSGKSVVISHLVEKKGFALYSMAATLRGIAGRRGISQEDRTALQDLGDELRMEHSDAGYLARLTLREIRRDHLAHRSELRNPARVVIGGFKRPEEVAVFRAIPEFSLVCIDVSLDETRFARANQARMPAYELRKTETDANGEEQLLEVDDDVIRDELDNRDRYGAGNEEYGQAVQRVVDGVAEEEQINNDGDLPWLYRASNRRVRELDMRYRRPRG